MPQFYAKLPENVLVKSQPPNDWWIKLTDFGLSKRVIENAGFSAPFGTVEYAAPEILWPDASASCELDELPSQAVFAADIWALGEMTFRMATGQASTFRGPSQLRGYAEGREQFPKHTIENAGYSLDAQDFISSLIISSYKERPTVTSALDNRWVQVLEHSVGSVIPHKPIRQDLSLLFLFEGSIIANMLQIPRVGIN